MLACWNAAPPNLCLGRGLIALNVLTVLSALSAPAMPSTGLAGELGGPELLQKYCLACHNADKHEAGVRLDGQWTRKEMLQDRALWRRVLHQLSSEEMPPQEPLPTAAERTRLQQWVAAATAVDWSRVVHSGHVTIPRLTRDEYNNTMRDLLGVDLRPGDYFSEDGQGESGFNTDRDALYLTPALMEKYLEAADRALGAALALERAPQVLARLESEEMFMTETRETPKKLGDDFFGFVLNRGQMTLYESVSFPHDGLYKFRVRVASTGNPTATRLRLNDRSMGDIQAPSRQPIVQELMVFVPRGSHQMAWNIEVPTTKAKPDPPAKPASRPRRPKAYTKLPRNANALVGERAPKNAPMWPADLAASEKAKGLMARVNATSISVQRPYEWLRLHGANGEPGQIRRFRGYIADRHPAYERALAALASEWNITAKQAQEKFESLNAAQFADRKQILAAVAKVPAQPQPPRARGNGKPGSVAIDWIEVSGPHRPQDAGPSVVTHQPGKDRNAHAAAEETLKRFMRRAFRRPVSTREVASRLALFSQAYDREQDYMEGLRLAMTAVLVSPHFVYRAELAPDREGAEPQPLSDIQLASRLSYMLWMSMPDDRLLTLAEQGKLSSEATLRAETRRMLADDRSRQFLEAFVGQWLGFGELGESVSPDPQAFPQFTPELARAMKAETVMYVAHLIRENESLLKLLDSDETYLNEPLANHYGIDRVRGTEMRLVRLTNPARGGLLGMGSILTATSSPQRTSPVLRGKWILETLLGETIPEPPADAGELPPDAGQSKTKTLREELMQHRRNPSCAACHDRIDPPGFGLEAFDAIGQQRSLEAGKPIDMQGRLADGATFAGPVELKQLLRASRKDPFIRNATQRLLSYSLGRRLELYDEPAIQRIVSAVQADNFGARTLVEEVVLSYPFRHQSAERPRIEDLELPAPNPSDTK